MCRRYKIRVDAMQIKFYTTYIELQSSIYENVHPERYIEFHSHHYRKDTHNTSIGATLVNNYWVLSFFLHHKTKSMCRQQDWPAGLSVTSSMVRSTALLTRTPDSKTGSLPSAAIENGYTREEKTVIVAISLESCLKVFGENVSHSLKKNNRYASGGNSRHF